MDIGELIVRGSALWSPLTFAVLVGVAAMLVWLAFAPSRAGREVEERLDDYLDRVDVLEGMDMQQPLVRRAALPLLRSVLGTLGRLTPRRSVEATEKMLVQAGRPGGLSALDFSGLRLLLALLLAGGYYVLFGDNLPTSEALRNTILFGAAGYFLPWYLLRRRVRSRQNEIARALPDALDMMTVGVEAGLAFESALVKVGEQWDNALTRELQRAVVEMRVGVPRNEALQRIAERAGVLELSTFVAVLIQSHQMGISIAQVLHAQAELMRDRRRQRAEELARQAGVKMVIPLIFLVFPALLVVILGPSVPVFREFFENVAPSIGGGGPVP
jgi:tight adherence protein C